MAPRTSEQALRLADKFAFLARMARHKEGGVLACLAEIYDLACEIALLQARRLANSEGIQLD